MSEHTKGPWHFHNGMVFGLDGTEHIALLHLRKSDDIEAIKRRDANGQIIAAALELFAYAECQEAIDSYDKDGSGFTRPQLEAVLVKHGFEPPIVTRRQVNDFAIGFRDGALAKAREE